MPQQDSLSLEWHGVEEGPEEHGVREVRLQTNNGAIDCRYHPAAESDLAILWVFGAGGGLGGPAGGLYIRLAEVMNADRVASLRLDYRRPGQLTDCVLDVLLGVAYLETLGRKRVVLVGHSFGGAVVINAGALSDNVIAVAALSSQSHGTEAVEDLSPRAVLLIHGEDDEVLPTRCSNDIYSRAQEPKQLITYPGCRHGLDDCRREVDRDLTLWLHDVFSSAAPRV
jgi:fermentation-respiration switch protein FrsA (DUF1100 family)